MAYALVVNTNIVGAANGGTSGTIDTTGASLLIIHISQYTVPASITPSDSKGNTWVGLTAITGSEAEGRLWYVVNPTVGTNHTFTASGIGVFSIAQIAAFSGANTSAPFDQETGAADAGTSGQPGSITPSENDCLLVTGLALANAGSTASINSSFTITDQEQYEGGVNEGGGLAYLIQTSASAVNPAWSWTNSISCAMTMASFKAASGGSVIKTFNGLANASIKTYNGLANASIKTWNGVSNQ